MIELGSCRLFFQAGLAVGLSFILGVAIGLAAMSCLHRREKDR
jgi:hypothetical protein